MVEFGGRGIEEVAFGGDDFVGVVDRAVDEAASDFSASVNGELVSRETFVAGIEIIVDEDAVAVRALTSHVVDAVAIAGEGAMMDFGERILEDSDSAVVHEGPFAGLFSDDVFAGVGDVADEEAIDNFGGTAGEEVDGDAGDLSTIGAKDAVFNDDGILVESLMLD